MDDIEFLQQNTPDKKFQYAFNSGYTLAKYQPEVLDQILFEIEQNGMRGLEGFKWGKWQYDEEKKMAQLKEIEGLRNKGRDIAKDFEKDR